MRNDILAKRIEDLETELSELKTKFAKLAKEFDQRVESIIEAILIQRNAAQRAAMGG